MALRILAPLSVTLVALVAACGSSTGGTGGSGGDTSTPSTNVGTGTVDTGSATGTTSTASTVTGSTGSTSTSSTVPSGCVDPPLPTGPCVPSSCATASSPCLAPVAPGAAGTVLYRMSYVQFTAPKALSAGLVSTLVTSASLPNDPQCNLLGQATFSWLLEYDLQKGAITTGSASPTAPGVFLDQTTSGFHVAPALAPAPLTGCDFASTSGVDVNLALYLDPTSAIVMPLRGLRFVAAALSADHACIGHYNIGGLDPASNCQPDATHPAFIPGGAVNAYISLAEADQAEIPPLAGTLCALLAGNDPTYTENINGVRHCKVDAAGKVLAPGDWCAATDQPANTGCADAVRVTAGFAAQAIKAL